MVKINQILKNYKKYRSGCQSVLVFRNGIYKIVSPDSVVNLTPISSNSLVYATLAMETMTVYRNSNNEIGVALIDERLDRLFTKTIPINEIKVVGLKKIELRKQILNYIAKESRFTFKSPNVKKATLRLNLIQGVGSYGIGSLTSDMVLSVEMVGLQTKENSGRDSILVGGFQRNEKFTGKRSHHYADGVRLKSLMERYNVVSILYFSNFLSVDPNSLVILDRLQDLEKKQIAVKNLAIADMIGAEIFAITSDSKLIYPPMSVNRLGGVTLEFVKNILAPKLGIKVFEQTFSIQDILDKKNVELIMCGNNAEITPISILRFEGDLQMDDIRLPQITMGKKLKEEFNNEIELGVQSKLLTIV